MDGARCTANWHGSSGHVEGLWPQDDSRAVLAAMAFDLDHLAMHTRATLWASTSPVLQQLDKLRNRDIA